MLSAGDLRDDGGCLAGSEWSVLKSLVCEVTELNVPAPADMLRRLNNVVREADECAHVAGHLARRLGLIGYVRHTHTYMDTNLYSATIVKRI